MLLALPLTLLALVSSALGRAYCSLKPPQVVLSGGTGSGGGPNGGGTGGGGGGGGTNPSPVCAEDRVFTSWYAGWHATQYPPEKISWSKYTSMTYAFATTTDNSREPLSLSDDDAKILPTFVETAHQNHVKALLSLGGWAGSEFFSTAMGSAANRTALVRELLDLINTYHLDGLDFDWEYPNRQGAGMNIVSSADASDFLATLRLLRTAPAAQDLVFSAAVSLNPFNGPDGRPLEDVSAYAEVLDYVEIMNYDVWGGPGPGPNSPLNDTCSSNPQGSAVSAVQAWTDANFPASQIVLGVASYGHSYNVTPTDAQLARNDSCLSFRSVQTIEGSESGGSWDSSADQGDGSEQRDMCGNVLPAGGDFDFWGLVSGGYLNSNGTATDDVVFSYDNCSQTPYVYSPATWIGINYDDATSFAAKGKFISDMGLKGFAMWEAGGDLNDILLNSITTAIATRETC